MSFASMRTPARETVKRYWALVVASGLIGSVVHAGVARIDPAKPRVGQEIVLTYRTELGLPGLRRGTDAYVLVRSVSHGIEHRTTVPMGPFDDGARTARFRIPEGASFLRCHFVNRWEQDPDAEIRVKIWADDERPVRGAWLAQAAAIFPPECDAARRCNYDDSLDRELELYPDNLEAHVLRWSRDRLYRQAGIEERIDRFIAGLPEESDEEAVDLIRLRMIAELLGMEIPSASRRLVQLLRLAPNSPVTNLAAGELVQWSLSARRVATVDEEALTALMEYVEIYPADPVSRHLVSLGKDRLTLSTLDAAYSAWIADEPGNPEPVARLAWEYEKREGSAERILELTELATDWMLSGETRIRFQPGAEGIPYYLPLLQTIRGRLLLEQGRTALALGAARLAAEHQSPGTSKAEMLAARIWRGTGRLDLAEFTLVEAMRLGDPAEARAELESIYRATNGDLEGFGSHLSALENRLTPSGTSAIAPSEILGELGWKTLDGVELPPDSWKGKVLVIDFWALGCGACIEEIPALNGIVEKFGDREDVLFVAPTPDDSKLLRSFLAATPFRFQVLPGATDWNEAFAVSVWPTHLIIDRNGELVLRHFSSKDAAPRLVAELERLLSPSSR